MKRRITFRSLSDVSYSDECRTKKKLFSMSRNVAALSCCTKIRDSLFKRFKSSSSPGDLKAYKQFRNRIVLEERESNKSYRHNYFEEHKNDMKMLWKGIKNVISMKPGNFDSTKLFK